jgi:Fe-S cluster assembly protein SufD
MKVGRIDEATLMGASPSRSICSIRPNRIYTQTKFKLMTTVTETDMISFNEEGFQKMLGNLSEPGWLTEMRQDAWAKFNELPWPSNRDEEWMRTDIRMFKLDKFAALKPESSSDGLPALVLAEGVELAGNVGSIDGKSTSSTELAQEYKDKGVVFGKIADLLEEHGDLIRKYLFQAVDPNFDRFSALHAAMWTSGVFLYVPRNVVLDKPVHISSQLTEGGSDLRHTVIVVEEGAEATVLAESNSAPETNAMHCGAIELFVGDRANLRYVNLQDWGQKVWHFAHQKGIVGRDSNLQWTVGALGSRLAKVNQHVALRGERANVQVNGAMFTENKQHLSYHTLQHHEEPTCTSDFLYKSALQDVSRTVWRGMIKVDQKAQQTDGYQRNDNLLLSEKARADSIPGLEIEADDVRCTHGSTSGRVDEELIFYAQCRGFTRKEAIRAIVTGFFQQVFDRITIESVREALALAIARRVRDYE